MAYEDHYKLVEFGKYCPECKYDSYQEEKYPCCRCIEVPARINSSKPEKFEPKDK